MATDLVKKLQNVKNVKLNFANNVMQHQIPVMCVILMKNLEMLILRVLMQNSVKNVLNSVKPVKMKIIVLHVLILNNTL